MKVLEIEQNTSEWKELRKTKVGASDIGILMTGTNKEINRLWKQKKGLLDGFETASMRRGSFMEAEALAFYQEAHGILFERPVGLHDEHDWLMASFDGLNFDLGISLEIKCPNHVPDRIEDIHFYDRYMWQIQAQLAVGGHSKAILFVYGTDKACEQVIERDEAMIEKLLKQGKWFHDLMVQDIEPPYAEILHDEDFYQKALKAKQLFDEAEQLLSSIKKEAIEKAESLETSALECFGLSLSKTKDSVTYDYKEAVAKAGIDLTPFQKLKKGSWRLSIN